MLNSTEKEITAHFITAWFFLVISVSAGFGKRLSPSAEGVPAPAKPEIRVGTLKLRRCTDAPAYCGKLPRKIDASGEVPGEITIGFQFYPHLDQEQPPLEPIIAMEGGPGYPSTGTRHAYLELFRPLMDRRDLLLVDNRGTGLSGAVNCPLLQSEPNPQPEGVRDCGNRMGKEAYLYGTAAAADDLAAVLDALQIPIANLYADSYGTYFSQAFVTRHGERLRSLVLDSAYPVFGLSPWYPEIAPASTKALQYVCERSEPCRKLPGSSAGRIAELVKRLRARPFTGRAPDADGVMRKVTADPATLAFALYGSQMTVSAYREADAAARAYLEQGEQLPLLRLLAESNRNGETGDNVSPRDYSQAIFVAVSCSDYPQIYDMHVTPQERRQERVRAFEAKRSSHPDLYAPFTIEEFDSMPLDTSVLSMCLEWPQAGQNFPAGAPIPKGAVFPKYPVLVLAGDLDTLTPVAQADMAAAAFPSSREVVVHNNLHITAQWDEDHCASEIVRRFVRELDPGDTTCAERTPEIHLVAKFAHYARELDPATPLPGNEADQDELKLVSAAVQTLGDALARWALTGKGVGLWGGKFAYRNAGKYTTYRMHDLRFVQDVRVSGSADWNVAYPREITARVKLRAGSVRGAITIKWNSRQPNAQAGIQGRVGRKRVAATMYAPY
jgi:pimeloyl-ACP methyl ester carboxylesterase